MDNAGQILLRVEQAAERLQLSRAKTYELVMGGVIPSITIGRSRRVSLSALQEWVDRQTAEAVEA